MASTGKKMQFTKMHGLGNDFIVLDARRAEIPGLQRLLKRLSHRRFGVGFDQALVLRDSRKADFRMDVYNGDGTRVEMCGNGIRCLAAYLWKRGLSRKPVIEIETLAGVMRPERKGALVRVDMGEPVLEGRDIPVAADGRIIGRPFAVAGRVFEITCVSMGNPHCVIFVENVDAFPISEFGPLIERNRFFPKRTNVEFVQPLSGRRLKMRVWERGSGETLACGTGASAALVAASLRGLSGRAATVVLKGGALRIEWRAKDGRVYMTGPAEEVFTGVVDI
jgi:diaminopimelate epimerase